MDQKILNRRLSRNLIGIRKEDHFKSSQFKNTIKHSFSQEMKNRNLEVLLDFGRLKELILRKEEKSIGIIIFD